MTQDQATELANKIAEIKIQIHNIAREDTIIHTDEYQANQTIADIRIKLAGVDQQLFGLYRYIDSFLPRRPVRATRTPTIDDLEI